MSDTLSVCGLTICRGSKLRTMLPVPGTEIEIPLTIINGAFDGPTLLVTAGIHGGEYPGIAAAMELGRSLDPHEIHGSLIMLHPVNIQGFWARREFIVPEDGKNLNRVFPGNPDGTLSEKTAGLISSSFFPLADFYVDLHSGDIHESLHPYVYYPGQPTEELAAKARSVAKVLNVEYMVRSMATGGAYNYAASTGLPSLLIERGGAGLAGWHYAGTFFRRRGAYGKHCQRPAGIYTSLRLRPWRCRCGCGFCPCKHPGGSSCAVRILQKQAMFFKKRKPCTAFQRAGFCQTA